MQAQFALSEPEDQQRLRYVLENYSSLRGLKALPFAVLYGLGSLSYLGIFYGFGIALVIILWSFVAAITFIGWWFTSNYYERTFKPILGVFPKPEPTKKSSDNWLLLVLAIVTYVLSIWLDIAFRLPISLTGLSIANLAMVSFLLQHHYQHREYLLISLAVLQIMSLLPLDGMFNDDILHRPMITLYLFFSLSFFLNAYFEHRLLTKARETLIQQGHYP